VILGVRQVIFQSLSFPHCSIIFYNCKPVSWPSVLKMQSDIIDEANGHIDEVAVMIDAVVFRQLDDLIP